MPGAVVPTGIAPADLFTLLRPEGPALPVVANLPHSGLRLPPEVAAAFTERQRRMLPNSDWHLQALYDFLPSLGVTVLQANYSRYVVDLNRAPQAPWFGSFWSSVVPERTAHGDEIHQRQPTEAAVRARVDGFHRPYHARLRALLDDMVATHGRVCLLDLHSFMGLIEDDVCLGDARGESCGPWLTDAVETGLARQQFGVVRNRVFSGGYITRHYGALEHVEALQIELRYPNYLTDEQLRTEGIPPMGGPLFEGARERLGAAFVEILGNCASAPGA